MLAASGVAAAAMAANAQQNGPVTVQACDYSAIHKKLSEGRRSFIQAFQRRPENQEPLDQPPASSTLVILRSLPNPLVHDAFVYHVAAGKDTGDVFVIESGGFAGVWHVYGPVANIPERPLCPAPPAASPDTSDAGRSAPQMAAASTASFLPRPQDAGGFVGR